MPKNPCQPLLGCATTRELLEEIASRGYTFSSFEEEFKEEKEHMAIAARNVLSYLPTSLLEYRTVDE